MKRCPQCNREYVDDSLRFCLDDGTPLTGSAFRNEAPATQILPAAAPTVNSIPTIPSYSTIPSPPRQAESRRASPILIIGVIAIAFLLMALVGIAGYFVYRQSGGPETANDNNNQQETTGKKKGSAPTEPRVNITPEPSPEVPDGPLKINASASSVRLAVQSNTYYATNAIDGKRTTAWIEGEEDGPGIGEWIRFDFDREINLHRILFQPGYFKSPQIWAQNNRLETVTAEFSDGSSRDLNFDDRMGSQKIDIGSKRTRWVRFVIKSVYYGDDPDTALSEVAFEWDAP